MQSSSRREFIEGTDYYLEDGRVVFTSKYLAEKEICCGTGCRHCPYIPRHAKDNKNLEEDVNNIEKELED